MVRSKVRSGPNVSRSVGVALAVLGFLVGAQLAGAKTNAGWEESAGLRCVVSDTLDPGARIFDSPDYQQSLVVPSVGDDAFLLALRSRTLRMIPKAALTWDDASRPIPDLSAGEEAGNFVSQDGSMVFVTGDETFAIEPEPPLVGALTLEKLKAAKPDYVFAARSYVPDAKALSYLKSVSSDVRVVVFFGSWCSHCKHFMPGFLKTLEAAGNPHLTAEIYGMNEDQTEPAAALRQYGASRTPSFIVMRGGKEIGRIEEEPEVSIESDLARILGAR